MANAAQMNHGELFQFDTNWTGSCIEPHQNRPERRAQLSDRVEHLPITETSADTRFSGKTREIESLGRLTIPILRHVFVNLRVAV